MKITTRGYLVKIVEGINLAFTTLGILLFILPSFSGITFFEKDALELPAFIAFFFSTIHSIFTLWIIQIKYPDKYLSSQQLSVYYLNYGLTCLAYAIILIMIILYTTGILIHIRLPPTIAQLQDFALIGLLWLLTILNSVSLYHSNKLVSRLQKNYSINF